MYSQCTAIWVLLISTFFLALISNVMDHAIMLVLINCSSLWLSSRRALLNSPQLTSFSANPVAPASTFQANLTSVAFSMPHDPHLALWHWQFNKQC